MSTVVFPQHFLTPLESSPYIYSVLFGGINIYKKKKGIKKTVMRGNETEHGNKYESKQKEEKKLNKNERRVKEIKENKGMTWINARL